MTDSILLSELISQAKKVSQNAYSPYSNFKVGAAFQDDSGNIYSGCNVENLAFPSSLCAERSAIVSAVSQTGPHLKIKILVVYTATDQVTTPCGACRQVMQEFSTEDTRVICVCDTGDELDLALTDLLPKPTKIDL